jgi:hypothetical protein
VREGEEPFALDLACVAHVAVVVKDVEVGGGLIGSGRPFADGHRTLEFEDWSVAAQPCIVGLVGTGRIVGVIESYTAVAVVAVRHGIVLWLD